MTDMAATTTFPIAIGETTQITLATRQESDAMRFSRLEWLVISLARNDRLASLDKPGRIASAPGRLFGSARITRLANPGLEALRRIAVHAWQRDHSLPLEEVRRFFVAGFGKDQLKLLLSSVSAGCASSSQRHPPLTIS